MRPISTQATIGIYGAPKGSAGVGGLPYYRTFDTKMQPRYRIPVIHSTWELDDDERRAIAAGAKIELAVWGEPMRPVSLVVVAATEVTPPSDIPEAFTKETFEDPGEPA